MSDNAKKQFSKLKSAFTQRLKTLFAETLEPLGFTQSPGKRQRWERSNVATPQICAFTYANNASAFYLKYNYYFTFCRECWANASNDAETQKRSRNKERRFRKSRRLRRKSRNRLRYVRNRKSFAVS